MKIHGVSIKKHDKAVELLERILNALFFEIDMEFGIALTISRIRKLRRFGYRRRRSDPTPLEFPKREYEHAPIALYWYARSAVGMPLLQYLSFYQVIEYFFPVYSGKAAAQKIKNILKNPTFRVNRESDIAKLLGAIGTNSRNSFGDEKSQLNATLQKCIDRDDLKNFYVKNNKKKIFLTAKKIDR